MNFFSKYSHKTATLLSNVSRLYRRIKRAAARDDISLRAGNSDSCAVGTLGRSYGEVFKSGEIDTIKAIARKAGVTSSALQQLENGFEGMGEGEGMGDSLVQPRSEYYKLGLRLREERINARNA